ncbi:MAG: hypothetical protein HY952_10895 [Elusimicrobia bacterium]|nr:hypothetical protein [Elusimicrobiota bacterium]
MRYNTLSVVVLSGVLLCACQPGAAAEESSSAPVPVSSQTRGLSLSHAAAGGPVKGTLNLNLNYPGAAFRCFVADGKALELLGQFQKDVSVGGLRYYAYPASLRQGALFPYFAFEADYADFKGSYSSGYGLGGGAFAGAEYFIGRRLSVQTDLGALYLSVNDRDTSISESGLEFILNLGVNIYFGKGGL